MFEKYKYAGAIGSKCVSIVNVETGDPAYEFSKQKIPAGNRFTVSGLTVNHDGDYQIHLQHEVCGSYRVHTDVYERCFIQA